MKLNIVFLIFLFIFFGCKESHKEVILEDTAIKVESTYEDLEGNPIELSDYLGKKVLVNYWATWCRPCIAEMPAMENLKKAMAEENYVFLFASDQSVKKIMDFKKSKKYQLDFIKFNGNYSDLEITALPVTIIYDEAGEQVLRIVGATDWDAQEMITKFKNNFK